MYLYLHACLNVSKNKTDKFIVSKMYWLTMQIFDLVTTLVIVSEMVFYKISILYKVSFYWEL